MAEAKIIVDKEEQDRTSQISMAGANQIISTPPNATSKSSPKTGTANHEFIQAVSSQQTKNDAKNIFQAISRDVP